MKALFLFLWRNNFTFFFLLLLSLCFYLLIQNNRYHNTAWFNSSNKVTGDVMNAVSSMVQYLNLRTTNRELAAENARLRTRLALLETDTIKAHDIRDSAGRFVYYAARVVNNSVTHRNNYLTLNRGSLDGIRPEMGVITSNGIVGIVKDVSPNYCTVMSILHKNTRISAGFKSSRYFGSLSWPGRNYRQGLLSDIARHVKFQKGDTIVTTGYSALFPEGIMVGTVEDWEAKDGSSFFSITIRFSTDYNNLTWVYIVNNLHQQERSGLESNSLSHDN